MPTPEPPIGSSEKVVVDWFVQTVVDYGACANLHNSCVDRLK